MPQLSELEDYDDLDYERYWQRYGGAEENPTVAWEPRARRHAQATVNEEQY